MKIIKKKKMKDIYAKALVLIQQKNPNINKIPDIYGIEDGKYYELVWDYPGKYYHQTLGVQNDEEFIQYIVSETIKNHHGKYPAI